MFIWENRRYKTDKLGGLWSAVEVDKWEDGSALLNPVSFALIWKVLRNALGFINYHCDVLGHVRKMEINVASAGK